MKKLYIALFSIYVGTGPVYWAPGVGPHFANILKIVLFLALLAPLLGVVVSGRFRFAGGGRVFGLFALLLGLSIPGVVKGLQSGGVYYLQNIAQIVLFIAICTDALHRGWLHLIAKYSALIFFGMAVLSLVIMIKYSLMENPINKDLFVVSTGLGGSRTGWSPSMAIFLPWALIAIKKGNGYARNFAALFIIGALVANQIITQGRTGIVADLFVVLALVFITRNYVRKAMAAALLALAAAVMYLLRSDIRLGPNVSDISNGRFYQYQQVPRLVSEAPIFGHGTGQVLIEGKSLIEGNNWVHNTVLRHAVEVGLPAAIIVSIIMLFPLVKGVSRVRRGDATLIAPVLTVVAGLATSLVEPAAIFGAFNMWAFWWICFTLCVAKDPDGHHSINQVECELRRP